MIQEEQIVLEDLVILRDNGPHSPNQGICFHVHCEMILEPLFRQWDKFSGNEKYPIPCSVLGSEDAYIQQGDMWDKRFKYNKLRWELLDFLIDKLEHKVGRKK